MKKSAVTAVSLILVSSFMFSGCQKDPELTREQKKWISQMEDWYPDDEFTVGNRLELEDMDCFIHAIKTRTKLVQHGSAEARDVVRIYGKYGEKSYPVLDFEDDVEDF